MSEKTKAVDAVNHCETKAVLKNMNATPVPRQASPGLEALRQRAAEAKATIQSVGILPAAVVATAYIGHIRQMDRQMQQAQRSPRTIQREVERVN